MEILKTVDLSHIFDPEELEPKDGNNFDFPHIDKRSFPCVDVEDETIIMAGDYWDTIQSLANSIMEDISIEKQSVEYLKGLGVNTFEQYKYYMTNDLDMINRIVDYTNSFIAWAIKVEPNVYGYHPYQFASVSKLPDPTEQYINALEYVWNKYSGMV